MLTPLEIEKRKYKKEFRGYSVEEVEEFNRIGTNWRFLYLQIQQRLGSIQS